MMSAWRTFIHLKDIEKLESKTSNVANTHGSWAISTG